MSFSRFFKEKEAVASAEPKKCGRIFGYVAFCWSKFNEMLRKKFYHQ